MPMSHVEFKKGPCCPVNFKKRPCRAVDFSGPPPLIGDPLSKAPWVPGVICQEFRAFGSVRKLLGASAHARIAEMECSGVRPCRENENIFKLVVN